MTDLGLSFPIYSRIGEREENTNNQISRALYRSSRSQESEKCKPRGQVPVYQPYRRIYIFQWTNSSPQQRSSMCHLCCQYVLGSTESTELAKANQKWMPSLLQTDVNTRRIGQGLLSLPSSCFLSPIMCGKVSGDKEIPFFPGHKVKQILLKA